MSEDKFFDELEQELNEIPQSNQQMGTSPNSLFCKLGFHKWNCWTREKVQLIDDNGQDKGFYTNLQRRCIRCALKEHRPDA